MGLSSPDSGSAPAKDVGNGPSSMNHESFGNTLMGLIQQHFPIAGALANAAGIGSPQSAAPTGGVPGQAPLPQFAPPSQQDGIDPAMLQAGQVGSQHSQLSKDILKALAGGG